MNMTTTELEQAIDEIMMLGKSEKPARPPKKRGRKKSPAPPVWALDFYNPARNRTFALISMCIKDDFGQSIERLALRIAAYKSVSLAEALGVLRSLRERGKLGYYDDSHAKLFRTWNGEEAGHGLENMCG